MVEYKNYFHLIATKKVLYKVCHRMILRVSKNLHSTQEKHSVLYNTSNQCYILQVPIPCVNAVDNAPCPTDPRNGFHYVKENVYTSADIHIRRDVQAEQVHFLKLNSKVISRLRYSKNIE